MLEMTIIEGPDRAERRIELLERRRFRIGRARECDVRLAHARISRRHAEIVPDGDEGWVLVDTGSTHGCHVGGERVERVPLTPETEVSIGPVTLRFANLASRIGRELDRLLDDDARPVEVEILTPGGKRTADLGETMV